ncbi:MAG: HEAT repeat domain-containing protein [Spirochaetaceae bacterium]
MPTIFLSEKEKKYAQKKVYTFQGLNGMGFNFMGETPVYLMAIQFGATNIELGFISSVIFLTGFILVFLPRLLAGKNLIKLQYTAWVLRGLFVLLYMFLFFLEGRPAVLLILVVYTLFCSARIVGVVIWNPLIKMVTTSTNRGNVLALGFIANQSASVISKLISFIVTSFKLLSGISGLLLLQLLGVILNTTAAFQLKKIPCREVVAYEKSRNLFVIFKESITNKKRSYPLLVRWISISVMVVNGLTIVFLRKEVGFSANLVFLYTMVIAFANILSGLFAKTFADRIGSRPLLIGSNILLSIFLFIWVLLPVSNSTFIPYYFYFILGFFSNFFLLSNNVLIDRVIVNTMPENDSFGYNSMINFVTASFSLITGLTGGLLIDKGVSLTNYLPNNFTLLFLFGLILSISMILISFKIIDKGSLSAKETASILFSLEGLRAYNYIGKLNNIYDPVKKRTVILSISQNDTDIATKELKSILSSPLSPVKGDVIKSLFNHPRKELMEELINEAKDSGSYHQKKAVFALGAYPYKEVEEVLLQLFKSDDDVIKSNAAKSLGRIGNKDLLEEIYDYESRVESPWDKLNYLIALKNMDDTGFIFSKVYQSCKIKDDSIFKQTYYSLVSDLLDFTPRLSDIYAAKNQKKGEGIKEFLEQTRDIDVFNTNHKKLISWFVNSNWDKIWDLCFTILKTNIKDNKDLDIRLIYLKKSIISELSIRSNNYDDALANLYFIYQLLLK